MAIEDIIWAKNRHMFGGIEPNEVQDFSARIIVKDSDTNIIRMTIKLPEDTVVNGQTLCSVSGVIVRGSLDGYPEDEFSGIDFGDYSENGEYDKEWDIDGRHTLYLSAFAYSDQGVVNRNAKHLSLKFVYGMTYHFGYDINLSDSNPVTRVSYPDTVDNYSWAAGDKYGYGSDWIKLVIGPYDRCFIPKPCIVDKYGNVICYLSVNNYSKDIYGNDITLNDSQYAMMQWPKIYTKRWEENGVYHFRCSDVKVDDYYECWCNYDSNGNEIDHFYTAIYVAHIKSYVAGSASGQTPNRADLNVALSRASNEKSGGTWSIDRIEDHCLILDLLTMMFGTTNLRSVLSSTTTQHDTGVTDTDGLFIFDGYAIPYSKVFGMENYWGTTNTYSVRHVSGLKLNDGLSGNRTITMVATVNNKEYEYDIEATNGTNRDYTYGCIGEMFTTPWGRILRDGGGSMTTYECSRYDLEEGRTVTIGYSDNVFGCNAEWYDSHTAPTYRLSFKPYK